MRLIRKTKYHKTSEKNDRIVIFVMTRYKCDQVTTKQRLKHILKARIIFKYFPAVATVTTEETRS